MVLGGFSLRIAIFLLFLFSCDVPCDSLHLIPLNAILLQDKRELGGGGGLKGEGAIDGIPSAAGLFEPGAFQGALIPRRTYFSSGRYSHLGGINRYSPQPKRTTSTTKPFTSNLYGRNMSTSTSNVKSHLRSHNRRGGGRSIISPSPSRQQLVSDPM